MFTVFFSRLTSNISSLYLIFDESPSRHADFELVTNAMENEYPSQFCAHRWVEDERVARKARPVWNKIPVIIDYWKSLPKEKQPGKGKAGANTSFNHFCVAVRDNLAVVKLFFEELANS